MEDAAFLPAFEQARLVRERAVSPVELVRLCLDRIERLDSELNAFVTVCAESALADARRATETPAETPFHGVPIPIKDLTETAGILTTFSSRAYADYVPEHDAAVVRRIREAGFIVLGKTNTPEFGTVAVTESELNGPCRNPWDPSRTPGGSSGGASAAVAAGMCAVAQGSDGAGSIRIPAACCGLFGLKPTRGRVSLAPHGPGTLGLASPAPLSRTVADAAALLDVMAGYEVGEPFWPAPPERPFHSEVGADPGRLRVALTVSPPFDKPVEPARAEAARECARLLADLGHDVTEETPPWHDERLADDFRLVWQTGPAVRAGDKLALVEPINRKLAEDAHATSTATFAFAVARLQAYARRVVGFWRVVDIVLTPALALAPPPVGWVFEPDDPEEQFDRGFAFTPFTPVVNLVGLPAAAVPFGVDDDGLPQGVQLIAGPEREDVLLRLSAQLEQARPWPGRPAAIAAEV